MMIIWQDNDCTHAQAATSLEREPGMSRQMLDIVQSNFETAADMSMCWQGSSIGKRRTRQPGLVELFAIRRSLIAILLRRASLRSRIRPIGLRRSMLGGNSSIESCS